MPPNCLSKSHLFLLIPFLLFLSIQNVQNADVYCYMGGGNSPSKGSTLGLQNVCVGNDSCFLIINTNNSWNSGCLAPAAYANISNPSATFCKQAANSEPAFCRCNSHFCNTPNNPNFYASLNTTLSSIIKPLEPGNLTCFECGNPLIIQSNGTKKWSTMDVKCDGSKYCTGKYCITRRSKIPRSYCATSWENIKQLACLKLPGDQFDDQECICQQSFCNYPYAPLNYTMPAPTTPIATTITAMATTKASTTVSTTTMNSALPPGNWQCMNSCNASAITLTKDSTNTTKLNATFFESPAGCQKAMVTCSGPVFSTVFFGNQGDLIAFQPNYTNVQALLYCIRNNNTNVWTRFGTSQNPNAQLTVNEAHCLVSASNTTPKTIPIRSTTTLSTPITTASPPPPGLFQCVKSCNSEQITMNSDTLNVNNFTSSLSEAPPGCGKLLLNCTVRNPSAYAVIEFGQFARDGGLIAFRPDFTNVQALLYCIKRNKGNVNKSRWVRFGTSSDPNAMVYVNQARCSSRASNIIPTVSPTTTTTTTSIPSQTATTPSTTLGTTTINSTTPPGNQIKGPWACVPGCNASKLVTTIDSSGRTKIRAEHLPAKSSMDCSKMRVTCTANSPVAAVGFGNQGTIIAFNGNLTSVTAELYCLRSKNSLNWTRFGTSQNPNAMFTATEAHCEMSNITTTIKAPLITSTTSTTTTTTRPPTTPAKTNVTMAPSTAPRPTTRLPPSTTIAVNQSLPPDPWQCLTGCNASQVTLTRDTTNRTTLISNGTFESPKGCTKLMVTCSAPPAAVVGFGNQGDLVAFKPNYTSVSALLYCIRNNGSLIWTRFGTTRDPNAMLTVTEAHCKVGIAPSTPTSTTSKATPSSTTSTTTSRMATSTTRPPSTPPSTSFTTTTRPSSVTPAKITKQPQSNPTGSSYVCPDGRKFGPNELAVKMAEILKKSMLGGLYNNGNGISAVQNFKDGIKTHICNYS